MANSPSLVKYSRLNFAKWSADVDEDQNGFDFFELTEYPDLPEQPDDIDYLVKTTDRIDLLAYKFYGDPVLWWVISIANDFELLPNDLVDGETIRIPSPRFVQNELFSTRKI